MSLNNINLILLYLKRKITSLILELKVILKITINYFNKK